MKTSIAWGKANDERWAQLDDVVSSKLKNCNSLTERLVLSQNTIYNEPANIFGHSQPHKRNLVGQIRRTKFSIQLIKEKNLLTAQIKTFSTGPADSPGTTLADVKYKIRSLRKSEKSRKRCWLVEKAKNDFKSDPNNPGKALLDPKILSTR